MAFEIGNGLYCCVAENRLIFLDLSKDRYFCLPEEKDAEVRDVLNRGHDVIDSAHLPSGIARDRDADAAFLPVREFDTSLLPLESEFDRLRQHASPGDIIEAIVRQTQAHANLKRLLLRRLIERLRTRKEVMEPRLRDDAEKIRRLAQAFRASRLFIDNHDKCLQRSLALAHCMLGRGLRPTFVIAVKFKPFAAHAWVQNGTTLLNDRLDNVLPYTPILVV
jgi:hypothetical protein